MNNKITYTDKENRIVYNIDFDGTLTDGSSYYDLKPNIDMINKVRELYYSGDIIIIWSARQWESANVIAGWCIMHNVPFHGLMLGKGGTDCYVDDKNVSIKDLLKQ
jgi:trehalose-6-phosphatase